MRVCRLRSRKLPQSIGALAIVLALAGCAAQSNGSQAHSGALASTLGWASAASDPGSSRSAGLDALNNYRAMAHLGPIDNLPALAAGDRSHSVYLVENYGEAIKNDQNLGINFHMEDSNRPGFSYAGFVAGKQSDVVTWKGGETPTDASKAVAGWLTAPFHRFSLLSPQLRQAGYGEYCHAGACAAALDTSSGTRMSAYRRLATTGGFTDQDFSTTAFDAPVEFPPDGSTFPLRMFDDHEWPDPLTSCPGYGQPTGFPVSVQIGTWVKTSLSAYSITAHGKGLEVCGIDSEHYGNPDMLTQRDARDDLRFFGAVILIPRYPLAPGTTYRVSATINGQSYQWSFKLDDGGGTVTE